MPPEYKNEYLDVFKNTYLDKHFDPIDLEDNLYYKQLASNACNYLSMALSTDTLESNLSHHLADNFNKNSHYWDKAIDRKYLETHIGGSQLHHNLDGSHTFSGALEALRKEFPEDSEFQNVLHMFDHLSRDLTTPSGINPFLDPDQFNAVKDYLHQTFDIPKSHINDLLNLNASELFGAVTCSAGILLEFNELNLNKLSQYVSRFSLTGFMAGNPLMLIVVTLALARICHCLWNGERIIELVEGSTRGVITAGAFLFTAAKYAANIYMGIATAAVISISLSYLHKKIFSFIKEDFDTLLHNQFPNYQSYVNRI